jgi:hypothetical protein
MGRHTSVQEQVLYHDLSWNLSLSSPFFSIHLLCIHPTRRFTVTHVSCGSSRFTSLIARNWRSRNLNASLSLSLSLSFAFSYSACEYPSQIERGERGEIERFEVRGREEQDRVKEFFADRKQQIRQKRIAREKITCDLTREREKGRERKRKNER